MTLLKEGIKLKTKTSLNRPSVEVSGGKHLRDLSVINLLSHQRQHC